MPLNRNAILVRRSLGETLAGEFKPLEASAEAAAVQGLRFLALSLEQRSQAALPPGTGQAAIDLIYAACQNAYQAQDQLRRVHAMWPAIAEETGFLAPECDPKGGIGEPSIRAAA